MNEIEEDFVKSLKALFIRYGVDLKTYSLGNAPLWVFENRKDDEKKNIFLLIEQVSYEVSK